MPVLHISGWYDDEEIGTPANFAAMVTAGRSGQRLLMGPWGHQVNAGRRLGELDFGHSSVIDLDSAMTDFLDQMVRGRPPADPPKPVRAFLMGADEWLDLESWPPPGAEEASLYLDGDGRANSRFGDGRLTATPPTTESRADEWIHDPDRPVPFITDASSAQIGGPDDYAGVQTRGDVLVYTSDVLSEPLDVIGPVRLVAPGGDVGLTTSDFTAMLLDVHPNGFAQRLLRRSGRGLRYRDGWHDRAAHGGTRHGLRDRGRDVGHLPAVSPGPSRVQLAASHPPRTRNMRRTSASPATRRPRPTR